jgi:hypothetical protein
MSGTLILTEVVLKKEGLEYKLTNPNTQRSFGPACLGYRHAVNSFNALNSNQKDNFLSRDELQALGKDPGKVEEEGKNLAVVLSGVRMPTESRDIRPGAAILTSLLSKLPNEVLESVVRNYIDDEKGGVGVGDNKIASLALMQLTVKNKLNLSLTEALSLVVPFGAFDKPDPQVMPTINALVSSFANADGNLVIPRHVWGAGFNRDSGLHGKTSGLETLIGLISKSDPYFEKTPQILIKQTEENPRPRTEYVLFGEPVYIPPSGKLIMAPELVRKETALAEIREREWQANEDRIRAEKKLARENFANTEGAKLFGPELLAQLKKSTGVYFDSFIEKLVKPGKPEERELLQMLQANKPNSLSEYGRLYLETRAPEVNTLVEKGIAKIVPYTETSWLFGPVFGVEINRKELEKLPRSQDNIIRSPVYAVTGDKGLEIRIETYSGDKLTGRIVNSASKNEISIRDGVLYIR